MLLELRNVSKTYASPDGGPALTVLRDVSLDLAAGQALAVTGPSGSGKSTLLHLIGALDRPSAGNVHLDGRDLAQLSDAELAALRNRRIGFVFQAHHLLPQLTALENVLVPTLANRRRANQAAAQRAKALLERVGLADRLAHRPGQLSGGERQRVAVARALINQPALLLADEPTGALDRESAQELADLLLQLNQQERVTLIVVTHWPELARRLPRQLELRSGRLVGDGGAS